MSEENKFDELIQSRISEREFAFDEMNWDEAEKQIIRQENRVRLTRYGLTFAGGIIAGMALMSPFLLTNRHVESNQTPLTINQPSQQSIPAQQLSFPKGITSEKNSTGTPALVSDGKTPVNSSPRTMASVSTRPVEQSGQAKGVPPVSFSSGSSVAFKNVAEQPKVNGTGFALNNSVVSNNKTSELQQDNVEYTRPSTDIVDSAIHAKFLMTTIKVPNPAIMPWYDSNAPEMPMLRTVYSERSRWGKYRNTVLLDGGVNYAFGWNNNGTKEGRGFTPIIGISFRHFFTSKISLSFGFQEEMLNGLNKAYASQVTQYDFGAQQDVTTLSPKILYYLGLPLKAGYNVNDKNILGGGLTLLYLLNASSTQTTYHETYFGTSNYSTATKWGYMDGFSSSDIQVSLSYTRMLSVKFGISLEYYYGLFNVENSSFFGANQFDRNQGARVELKYRILK